MNVTGEGPGAARHLGDDAELYALGALEPDERVLVDAHVATCAACARTLAAAAATVAALDDAFIEQIEPPARLGARIAASARAAAPRRIGQRMNRPLSSDLAMAASLILALGVGGGAIVEHAAGVRQAANDSAVLATIATSHFLHVSLTARESAAPVSKAIYGRDGTWLYVVIDSAACTCHVVARSAAGERDLGSPDVRGTTSTLFTRDVLRPTSLALIDTGGGVISDTNLIYPAETTR